MCRVILREPKRGESVDWGVFIVSSHRFMRCLSSRRASGRRVCCRPRNRLPGADPRRVRSRLPSQLSAPVTRDYLGWWRPGVTPDTISLPHTSSDTMADIDDDLIVVDDVDDHDAFQPSHRASASKAPARTQPARASRGVARRQSTPPYADSEGRTTRSTARGPKLQPKLKLKLSEKAAAQAPGMSFLGAYDRELDSDDEDLVFEEQFILRMPPGEDCERLRKMVQAREVSDDVWFKFKGASF